MGYLGGSKKSPTYYSMGDHTETVQIDFDPQRVSYEKLLEIFADTHDTTRHASRQYMSAVFAHSAEQEKKAKAFLAELSKKMSGSGKVATEVIRTEADDFTVAEDYHQKYLLRNRTNLMDAAKLDIAGLLDTTAAAKLNALAAGEMNKETLLKLITAASDWDLPEQPTQAVKAVLSTTRS